MFKQNSMNAVTGLIIGTTLAFALVALIGFAMPASAATYAYVDRVGEVKSVIANDWMTAINTAPNIHMHSGVLLLKSASDFGMIGDEVNTN